VEFLTDSAARNNKNQNVSIAGVVAQPLKYLTLSLQRAMNFQTYADEVGRVVSPEAWVFHKGLTFTRRKTSSKRLKDLYGIWYVVSQLGEFSDQVLMDFGTLKGQHTKWFATFGQNLKNWMHNASPAEWYGLEAQDPSGRLKKLSFERVVKRLLG